MKKLKLSNADIDAITAYRMIEMAKSLLKGVEGSERPLVAPTRSEVPPMAAETAKRESPAVAPGRLAEFRKSVTHQIAKAREDGNRFSGGENVGYSPWDAIAVLEAVIAMFDMFFAKPAAKRVRERGGRRNDQAMPPP